MDLLGTMLSTVSPAAVHLVFFRFAKYGDSTVISSTIRLLLEYSDFRFCPPLQNQKTDSFDFKSK